MGYWDQQVKDLEETINACECDTIICATPMDLRKLIKITKPCVIVTYGIEDKEKPFLSEPVNEWLKKL